MRVKCLVTPSLGKKEMLLDWQDMICWDILKPNFNVLDDDMDDLSEGEEVDEVKQCSSAYTPTRVTGGRAAAQPSSLPGGSSDVAWMIGWLCHQ